MIYSYSDPVVARAVAHASQMRADAMRAAFASTVKVLAARLEYLLQIVRPSRTA